MGESFGMQYVSGNLNIVCVIDGTDIYRVDMFSGRQCIGKTSAAYDELEQTTAEYYNKLVELGVIVPPKTQEQMIADLQNALLNMGNTINALNAKIEKMGGTNHEPTGNFGTTDENVSRN